MTVGFIIVQKFGNNLQKAQTFYVQFTHIRLQKTVLASTADSAPTALTRMIIGNAVILCH
jgi:hypothetical protein